MSHPALARQDHRPWPVPARAWTWRQSWCDLLFAHWPAPVETVRSLVPAALAVDVFDGVTWLGIVPFHMSGVMRRPLPDLPWVSAFPELNVRLYVTHEGKPGVWFLSLDAANALAVWAARRFFHLPYFQASMAITPDREGFAYRSARRDSPARFAASYRPVSTVYEAAPGTLEHWLTERYCLYAQRPDGALLRTEVHHAPWPLQRAEAAIEVNTLVDAFSLTAAGPAPLLHFARRLDVVVWPPERLT